MIKLINVRILNNKILDYKINEICIYKNLEIKNF